MSTVLIMLGESMAVAGWASTRPWTPAPCAEDGHWDALVRPPFMGSFWQCERCPECLSMKEMARVIEREEAIAKR